MLQSTLSHDFVPDTCLSRRSALTTSRSTLRTRHHSAKTREYACHVTWSVAAAHITFSYNVYLAIFGTIVTLLTMLNLNEQKYMQIFMTLYR